MTEVSPEELFNQLRESIAILAAPAHEQAKFLTEDVPAAVDDLFVQLDMVVPAWFGRLEAHGLIDRAAETEIMSLYDHLDRMSRSGDHSLWASDDALFTKREWEEAREHAKRALGVMGPPKPVG